jgi:hypothetical protein
MNVCRDDGLRLEYVAEPKASDNPFSTPAWMAGVREPREQLHFLW